MSIGLYIHVPFCLKKCNYCDFISYIYNPVRARQYRNAVIKEMELYSRQLPSGDRQAATLYIGGGTPTCLPVEHLVEIIEACRTYFNLLPGSEVSLEANPGTLDTRKISALYRAGVNRLSLGVQASQEELLLLLGRIHSFPQAVEAVEVAREAGLANISLDLIFGLPGQRPEQWESCLEQVLELAPTHISTYGLQLEENTPLAQEVRSGKIKSCSEEAELQMYRQAIKRLTAAGYDHYEISNFALPGYQCKHNLRYWRNLTYLGLGPAAHSCLNNRRFSNEIGLDKYYQRIMSGESAVAETEEITPRTGMSETMFLGLRLMKGVDSNVFASRFGQRMEEVFAREIERLLKLDLIEFNEGFLRLSRRGLPLANQVFLEFVQDVEDK